MVKSIVVLSGPPGSGKSHWAAAHCASNDIYLSRDDFRECVRNYLKSDKYFPISSKAEQYMWYNLVEDVLWNSDADCLYIDQTTINWKAFAKLFNNTFMAEADIPITSVKVKTPISVCIARNEAREAFARVPRHTLINMYDCFTEDLEKEIPREFRGKVNVEIVSGV